MTEGDTLGNALADVRGRLADVQAEHERLTAELAKLRMAERSLAAIVEGGGAADEIAALGEAASDGEPRPSRGRGSRGPRANSAKGRLKAILEGAGPQGLSQAEIARRLPDVAPSTLNAYLSMFVSSGEALRNGDFVRIDPAHARAAAPEAGTDDDADDQADAAE